MEGGMTMKSEGLVISSEAELFEVIQRLHDDSDAFADFDGQISFGDWSKVVVRMRGPAFSSSITPPVMKAFLDLQKGINHSYSLVTYGEIRRLSREESEALEIKVEVGEGSSVFTVNLQSLLETTAEYMVDKMEPHHLLVGLLVIAAAWGTVAITKEHIASRERVRIAELASEEERSRIEGLAAMSAQETERARLYARLINSDPRLSAIDEEAKDATQEMVKAITAADVGSIAGITIDRDQAATLSANARERSSEVRLDGVYRVTAINSKDPESFKIEVFNTETRESFKATVQETSMSRSNRRVLEQAVFDRKPVRLEINANNRRGQIVDAVIMKAEIPATS